MHAIRPNSAVAGDTLHFSVPQSRVNETMCSDPDHVAAVAQLFKGSSRMTAAGLMRCALAVCDADYKASQAQGRRSLRSRAQEDVNP